MGLGLFRVKPLVRSHNQRSSYCLRPSPVLGETPACAVRPFSGTVLAMETDITFDFDAERWVTDDDHRSTLDDFTLAQAMLVAEFYGGGEFDDETADIVNAMCALRDHIKKLNEPEDFWS